MELKKAKSLNDENALEIQSLKKLNEDLKRKLDENETRLLNVYPATEYKLLVKKFQRVNGEANTAKGGVFSKVKVKI